MQPALRDFGLAWGAYELNQALCIALTNEACEAAWLDGDDVFGPALIEDVSLDQGADPSTPSRRQGLTKLRCFEKAAAPTPSEKMNPHMTEDAALTDLSPAEVETAISACVKQFYGKAREDELLGPIFNGVIANWDLHLRVIEKFWSKVLLQTDGYSGSPFTHHVNLAVELEHFERWLSLFEEAANATLPAAYAQNAIAKARHMAESFKAGIFPFVDKTGKPVRRPQ